jgi:CDP-2,3-bis-(O-geranylgeranyl)-sn-glycerol synthase
MLHAMTAAVYLFLPAGVANMAPVFLARFLGEGRPVDGGASWRGKRLFGDHKTWQGLIGGTLAGLICYLLQRRLYGVPLFQSISLIDYEHAPAVIGLLMGSGALIGDLVKSFFKRRLDIDPGKAWFPFDQIDYIAGAIGFTFALLPLSAARILLIVGTFVVLHLIVSATGFALHLKEQPL